MGHIYLMLTAVQYTGAIISLEHIREFQSNSLNPALFMSEAHILNYN